MSTTQYRAVAATAGLLITLLIISLIELQKSIRSYKMISSRISEEEEKFRTALQERIEAIKVIMDAVAMSGENKDLLYNKIHRFIDDRSEGNSLVKNMTSVANLVLYGLIDHLRQIYPNLSDDDLEFCSLVALGFPAHTIQSLYKYSNTSSYYNKRKRLRSKISLNSSRNLEAFLSSTIEDLRLRREINTHYFSKRGN